MATTVEKKLQSMRLHNADARAVFDALLTYDKNMSEVTVDRLQQKTRMRPRAIRAVLQDLEQLELGKLVIGRRGWPTRFEWREKYTEIIPGPLKDEPKKGEGEPVAPKGASVVRQWVCKLGPKRDAHLLLPVNATNEELRTVLKFLESRLAPA
jgi:hypothetical protein